MKNFENTLNRFANIGKFENHTYFYKQFAFMSCNTDDSFVLIVMI